MLLIVKQRIYTLFGALSPPAPSLSLILLPHGPVGKNTKRINRPSFIN